MGIPANKSSDLCMEEMIKELGLTEIHSDSVQPGQLILRIHPDKVQQGRVAALEDGSIVLENVIDLKGPGFLADLARLKPTSEDHLYIFPKTFADSDHAEEALKIVTQWPLFKNSSNLQEQIQQFVENSYTPEQILFMSANDRLRELFIPLQQRFKIGKFDPAQDPNIMVYKKFKEMIDGLASGKYLYYVAFIPKESVAKARFYSIGIKIHQDTIKHLNKEIFAFRPNHGGHIMAMNGIDEPVRKYAVDAGSNDLGMGTKTSIETAQIICRELSELFPDYEFVAFPGQDAYGLQQGY